MAQALVNYLGNAMKFTEQGHITLRSRKLDETDSGYLLRFEVEDTGIGISLEAQPRLFDAFEQADNSTTRKFGGTGLGLAITKRIAQLMGGDVGVVSEPGKGSLFWLTASIGKASAMETRTVNPPALTDLQHSHFGAKILLVEDDAINQEVAKLLLEEVHLTVDIAENGLQAVNHVENQDYALVLMDIQMPEMNGMEATRAIRAMPHRKNLPILALTANAFDEDRRLCEAAGMNGFIAKPFDPDNLYAIIALWLNMPNPPDGDTAGAGGAAA
jgi:CheY-like chemotaxis protein